MNPEINVPDVVNKVYNDLDLETRELLPEKESLMKQGLLIQKGKKPSIPDEPKTLEELEIPEEFQKLAGDDSIFYD